MKSKIKIENPVYKKAWHVAPWSGEILEGVAITLTYVDSYEQTRVLFIEDGAPIPRMARNEEVTYEKVEAQKLLDNDKKSIREYYEKKIKEYQSKLNELK